MLFPLVQLFAEAVHIAPVENSLPDAAAPPLAQELLTRGLLRFHCPAPLGPDRERFLRLLSELRQRPGEYAALALQRGEAAESGQDILSALRRSGRDEQASGTQERLWQARLVLTLGGMMERQEEELRENLRRIALRERSLLQALRDDQAEASCNQDAPAAGGSRTRLRLKAWQTLVTLGGRTPASGVFVTDDREAFELFTEQTGGAAQDVLALPLPAFPAGGGGDVLDKRNQFRAAAAGMIEALSEHPADFPAKEWESLLEEQYPANAHGRCRLSLLWQKQAAELVIGLMESAALSL